MRQIYSHKEGYVRLRIKGKYVLEHRYVLALALKRPLTIDEVVHHRNGNRQDNRLENLVLTTYREHGQHHAAERFAQSHIQLCCAVCSTPFFRRKSKVTYDRKGGHTRFCCSRKCQYDSLRKTTATHGTLTTYFKCGPPRCALCKEAMRKYKRAYRKRS